MIVDKNIETEKAGQRQCYLQQVGHLQSFMTSFKFMFLLKILSCIIRLIKVTHVCPFINVAQPPSIGSLRNYDGNCKENVTLKLNFNIG